MDFCTDSVLLKVVSLLHSAMSGYITLFAWAGIIALLMLACMLCMNDRVE